MKQVIVITGGNSGLGKATAKILSKRNKVVILGRNEKEVSNTSKSMKCHGMVCDVASQEQVKYALQFILKKYKKIDCLINCAGVYLKGQLEDNDPEKIKDLILINTLGPILTTREVVPHMKKRKAGKIINVSSINGTIAKRDRSVYNSSKWAMTGFTNSLQMDLQDYGISVMGFYPGLIKTEIFKHAGYTQPDLSQAMDVNKCASVLSYMAEIDSDLRINHLEVESSKFIR